jgi:hypothetical protein
MHRALVAEVLIFLERIVLYVNVCDSSQPDARCRLQLIPTKRAKLHLAERGSLTVAFDAYASWFLTDFLTCREMIR